MAESIDKMKKGARKGLQRALEGAKDLAATAQLKMDIGKINGRREEAITEIGRQVYAMYGEGRGVSEVKELCKEITALDKEIERLEAEIERVQRED